VTAYYNEIDPKAAAWLRELITRGLIAPGEVDERSILGIVPSELAGFTQCHFFAGIGVWSYALRCAGWSDDRPVWTGSCPCQPFSAAGKGGGFDDERHLWPAFNHLIGERRPGVVFGEQVASKNGLAWLDLVQADLEGKDYAFGAFDLCAAGFGAPHIRQRLYWVADDQMGRRCEVDSLAGRRDEGTRPQGGERPVGGNGASGRVEDPQRTQGQRLGEYGGPWLREQEAAGFTGSGSARGWWGGADYLWCQDEKYRPTEPGTFPLVTGASARVVRLRGYGNAIVAPVAQEFIEAYMMRSDGNS